MQVINSILNLIANLMLLVGGFSFYYNFISIELKPLLYQTLRFFTAMLVTGALARVLFDINIIIVGENKNFDLLEAIIALSRNLGLGAILLYLVFKK